MQEETIEFSEQDLDLTTANNEQLIAEVKKWRRVAPSMIKIINQLNEFRSLAESADDIRSYIDNIKNQYMGTIELQNKQIAEMDEMLQQIHEDPMGLDNRINEGLTKKTTVH